MWKLKRKVAAKNKASLKKIKNLFKSFKTLNFLRFSFSKAEGSSFQGTFICSASPSLWVENKGSISWIDCGSLWNRVGIRSGANENQCGGGLNGSPWQDGHQKANLRASERGVLIDQSTATDDFAWGTPQDEESHSSASTLSLSLQRESGGLSTI